MASTQELSKKDAVRIKVIKHSSSEADSQCCRFSVAPELTNYEVFHNLIARAFDIKKEFQTCYLARDDRLPEACWLPLLSDFDLELAFHRSSDPNLLVKVEMVTSNGTWDVSNIDLPKFSLPDLPKNTYSVKLPGLLKEKMEKTLSIVQKALSWNEDEEEPQPLRRPLTDADFQKMLDTLGTLKDSRELRLRVYIGGVEPSLRKVVWKHLLNVYPDSLTGRQRMDYMKEKTSEYYQLRKTWLDHLSENKNVSDEVKYTTNMVRKDVLRTDRHHPFFSGPDDNDNVTSLFNILTTYSLNHPSVGYCQGMSDLASPLLVTMKDEAQAYVCFCALMSRVKINFHIDGDAMTLKFQHLTEALLFYDAQFFSYLQRHQADDLLFCYRWLLLELKREFAFDDAQIMLEVLWSSLPLRPPDKSLPLVEVLFNPVKASKIPSLPTTPRQNHYANVCALRRQRSCVSNRSAECLAATLHRRAISVDLPDSCCQKILSRTLSQPDKVRMNSSPELVHEKSDHSPVHGIKEELSSPEESPLNNIRKIRDLKEFKKLTSKIKDGAGCDPKSEMTQSVSTETCLPNGNGCNDVFNGARRCFSDSDADIGVPVFDEVDVEVWQNPILVVSPDEDSQDLEIIVQEEKPSAIKLPAVSSGKDSNTHTVIKPCSDDMNSSINSCEEVTVSGWQVSLGGTLQTPSLPPPEDFGGGNPFLMFLCVTLIIQHRNFIMQQKMDHNELAMHFDKMVRKHNVHKVLTQARRLFEAYLKLDFSKVKDKNSPNASGDQPC